MTWTFFGGVWVGLTFGALAGFLAAGILRNINSHVTE